MIGPNNGSEGRRFDDDTAFVEYQHEAASFLVVDRPVEHSAVPGLGHPHDDLFVFGNHGVFSLWHLVETSTTAHVGGIDVHVELPSVVGVVDCLVLSYCSLDGVECSHFLVSPFPFDLTSQAGQGLDCRGVVLDEGSVLDEKPKHSAERRDVCRWEHVQYWG